LQQQIASRTQAVDSAWFPKKEVCSKEKKGHLGGRSCTSADGDAGKSSKETGCTTIGASAISSDASSIGDVGFID
jgi:hypothetical protein